MEEKIKPRFLAYDSLNSMLEEHYIYQTSLGKLGKRVDLSICVIEDFDFSGIDLSNIFAIGSIFNRCKFRNCDLYGTIFDESKFIGADFSGANLGKANFYQVVAKNACFDNTNCAAEFDESNLSGSTFRNVNFGGASFVDCDLTDAIFDGADLTDISTGGDNKLDNTSWFNIKGQRLLPRL